MLKIHTLFIRSYPKVLFRAIIWSFVLRFACIVAMIPTSIGSLIIIAEALNVTISYSTIERSGSDLHTFFDDNNYLSNCKGSYYFSVNNTMYNSKYITTIDETSFSYLIKSPSVLYVDEVWTKCFYLKKLSSEGKLLIHYHPSYPNKSVIVVFPLLYFLLIQIPLLIYIFLVKLDKPLSNASLTLHEPWVY